MSESTRSDAIALIRQRVLSVDDLEALLLLMNNPTRSWSAAEVASALGSTPELMSARLFLLSEDGFLDYHVQDPVRYRYVVSDDEEDLLLRDLATASAEERRRILGRADISASPFRRFLHALGIRR